MEVKVYPPTVIWFCWLCYVIALEMLPVGEGIRDDLGHMHNTLLTCAISYPEQWCNQLNQNENKEIVYNFFKYKTRAPPVGPLYA